MAKEVIDIKEFVKGGNIAHFEFYRSGIVYYLVRKSAYGDGPGWIFPIPLDDIGNATLGKEEKAIRLMRWIRKAIEEQTFIKQV